MQGQFDFGGKGDIARWKAQLTPLLDDIELQPRRRPIGQLVKSMISGKTRDPVSQAAYDRLCRYYRSPRRLAQASPAAIARLIEDVTFPEEKAQWLVDTLRAIRRIRPDFDLDYLGALPIEAALLRLERLPGIGRKVAASTLNASTLARPVFIVDTHVLRVLQRLGFVSEHADIRKASEAVTGAMPGWTADDFLNFHVMMKRLGQIACRPDTPGCARCPLAADCRMAQARSAAAT